MKTVEEIAHVITVRNHLALLLNGTRNVVRKQDVQPIGNMISKLDIEIIQAAMEIFAAQTKVAEDEDVAKRVAEAKAKLAAKATPAPAAPVAKPKKVVKRAPAVADDEAVDSNDQ